MDKSKTSQLAHMRLIKSPESMRISVPSKLPDAVEHIPIEFLKAINKDITIAKELCLYFASLLNPTYFSDDITKVGLHSDNLMEIFKCKYPRIIEALRIGTPKKGPIIECDDDFVVGEKPKCYWYADTYSAKRCGQYLVSSKLETKHVLSICIEHRHRRMKRSQGNIIINNLLNVYPMVGLPDVADLKTLGRKLADEGKTSKKGKIYKICHRNKSRYSKEQLNEFSFIEDGIKRFRHLTQNGYMIPSTQGIRGGYRVTDTFNLLNSWIRSQVTINGRIAVECDFTCAHPNIAIGVYDGDIKYITHKRLAEYCDIDITNEVELKKFKTLHLTFFNKHPNDMKYSKKLNKIYEFYATHAPEMLNRILKEKSAKGYKITCQRLFAKEVEIMTQCIKKLNAKGIYVLYIYDALLCDPLHKSEVEQVMNKTVLECGVYTATFDKNYTGDVESSEQLELPEHVTESEQFHVTAKGGAEKETIEQQSIERAATQSVRATSMERLQQPLKDQRQSVPDTTSLSQLKDDLVQNRKNQLRLRNGLVDPKYAAKRDKINDKLRALQKSEQWLLQIIDLEELISESPEYDLSPALSA